MGLLYPYDCPPGTCGDGFALQMLTDASGLVPDGTGGMTLALDFAGAPIGPNTLTVSFYGPDGAYINSISGGGGGGSLDGYANQSFTDGGGLEVSSGALAVDITGAPIGPNALCVHFFDGTGSYINSYPAPSGGGAAYALSDTDEAKVTAPFDFVSWVFQAGPAFSVYQSLLITPVVCTLTAPLAGPMAVDMSYATAQLVPYLIGAGSVCYTQIGITLQIQIDANPPFGPFPVDYQSIIGPNSAAGRSATLELAGVFPLDGLLAGQPGCNASGHVLPGSTITLTLDLVGNRVDDSLGGTTGVNGVNPGTSRLIGDGLLRGSLRGVGA